MLSQGPDRPPVETLKIRSARLIDDGLVGEDAAVTELRNREEAAFQLLWQECELDHIEHFAGLEAHEPRGPVVERVDHTSDVQSHPAGCHATGQREQLSGFFQRVAQRRYRPWRECGHPRADPRYVAESFILRNVVPLAPKDLHLDQGPGISKGGIGLTGLEERNSSPSQFPEQGRGSESLLKAVAVPPSRPDEKASQNEAAR